MARDGYTPRSEIYATLLAEWDLAGMSPDTLNDDFRSGLAKYAVAYPGLVPMLKALRHQGLRPGLITNSLRTSQAPKVEALALEQYLDAILISEVEGVRKPDPEIFRRALMRVGATPPYAMFVGDHPVFDVADAGAKSFGLKTMWKRNDAWPAPDAPTQSSMSWRNLRMRSERSLSRFPLARIRGSSKSSRPKQWQVITRGLRNRFYRWIVRGRKRISRGRSARRLKLLAKMLGESQIASYYCNVSSCDHHVVKGVAGNH